MLHLLIHTHVFWSFTLSCGMYHIITAGPSNTPFENGHFLLVIDIPSRYPHDPPRIRFLTKMHHPNIDSQGRVAIESLNLTAAASNSCCNFRDQQQQHDTCSKIHESSMLLSPSHLATWNPNITILNLLIQIRELLKQPNFKNDGLCTYRFNYTEWWKEARKLTVKEATLAKLEYIEEAFLKTLRRDLFGIDCNNSDAGYCGKNQRKWKVKLQPKRNRLHRENHNDDNDDDNCVMIRGKRKLYQHHDFITDDDDDNTHVQLRKKSTSLLSSSSYYLNN